MNDETDDWNRNVEYDCVIKEKYQCAHQTQVNEQVSFVNKFLRPFLDFLGHFSWQQKVPEVIETNAKHNQRRYEE